RRQAIHLPLYGMRHPRQQRFPERLRGQRIERGSSRQKWKQPILEIGEEGGIRHVGPRLSEPAMQPAEPLAKQAGGFVPGKDRQAMRSYGGDQGGVGGLARRRRSLPFGKGQGAQSLDRTGTQRPFLRIEMHLGLAPDMAAERLADFVFRDRRGAGDAAVSGGALEIG